jgi:hypothetical protein
MTIFKKLLVSLALVLASFQLHAATYGFSQITSNGTIDISGQLSVSVEEGTGGAYFTFFNDVGVNSSIAGIFFDSGNLFSDITVDSMSAGVVVSEDNNPGGFISGFDTTFSASKDGKMSNGIDSTTEWAKFFASYDLGTTFDTVLASIDSLSLQLGLHVISIDQPGGGDQSEKFINEISSVPVPAAAFLFAPAMLGLMGLRRKNKNA